MAYLLGSENCITALQRDITEIQESINGIFSRTGPVRYPSWKYPDKISSDIDVDEIISLKSYREGDEENNQMAHFILLELVIDRLMLCLQSSSQYIEQTAAKPGASVTKGGIGRSMSVGLVVKKFWNKAVQMHSVVQQLSSESREKTRSILKLEEALDKLTEENFILRETEVGDSNEICSNRKKISPVSLDTRNVGSQTIETAFVPCEACHLTQHSLAEVSKVISKVCQSQNLKSDIESYQRKFGAMVGQMAANDLSGWGLEQCKDLAKINTFISDLHGEIDPLKKHVTDLEEKSNSLKKDMDSLHIILSSERSKQNKIKSEHEIYVKENKRKFDLEINSLKEINKELITDKNDLDERINKLSIELAEQKSSFIKSELANKDLSYELGERQSTIEVFKRELGQLETEVESLKGQLDEVTTKLSTTTKLLNKELAKSKSLNKHNEALKGKQDSLLGRLDELDTECNELRNQVGDLEADKEDIEREKQRLQDDYKMFEDNLTDKVSSLRQLSQDNQSMVSEVDSLRAALTKVEIELDERRDRMRMMAAYPDLTNIDQSDLTIDYQNDTLVGQMEKQLIANNIRIQVLEEFNESLRNSVSKLDSDAINEIGVTDNQEPVKLWKDSKHKKLVESGNKVDTDLAAVHGMKGYSHLYKPFTK